MDTKWMGWPGKIVDRVVETGVVSGNLLQQSSAWFFQCNRVIVLNYMRRHYPECFAQLDGGDKRIIRAFLDPEGVTNTYSILGGRLSNSVPPEYAAGLKAFRGLALDALGSEATFDNSFVERDAGVDDHKERWFFVNGILTSREIARFNVAALRELFNRPFTLIHNPTQGLTEDLVESALEKFTNINTEPVARAFLEIGNALLEDRPVVVVAHSQGTIIMGDVLDLIYGAIDRKNFDRTNMTNEEFDSFMGTSTGTVKSHELRELAARLHKRGPKAAHNLELYLFANAASRVCYLGEKQNGEKFPHIESFANHHDIITRLGVLARDEFHREDLLHIDGPLFACNRYGHLLNAHYLPDFLAGNYRLLEGETKGCVGTSVHDDVVGNPCRAHPEYAATKLRADLPDRAPEQSKLYQRYQAQKKEASPPQPPKLKSDGNASRPPA